MNKVKESNHERAITPQQMRKLFASMREVGMDNDELHDLVARVAGVNSIRDLSRHAAAEVIEELVVLGASGPQRRARRAPAPREAEDPAKVIRLASDEQLRTIGEFLKELGLDHEEPYFRGLVKKATGRSWFSTSTAASKVIEALKSLRLRRQGGDQGQAS